jgi:ankyrin repeat protein
MISAVKDGHENMVVFLMESGVDFSLRDLKGRTALDVVEEVEAEN